MNIDYQNEYVFIIKDGTAPMQRLGRSQNMSSISVQKKETIATPRQPQTNPQTRSASVKQTTPLEQPISTPSSESELLPVPTVITELPDDRVADERITPPAETTIVAIQPVSIRDQATYTRFSSIYG